MKNQVYLNWYENMLLWRKFEEKCAAMYIQQKIRGFLHLYSGQEAVLAGCAHALDVKKDKMITAYRCHVHPIAMGLDPKYIMAELFGKVTGSSNGKGGSMHIFSKEHNFFGGHGIVGGQIPLGAGMAFADKYNNTDAVTLCFMGDGAVRQGSLHETFNMAMNWKLPVIFICENNGYAMGTSVERTANHADIWKLGLGYEMPSEPVNGMNPEDVYKSAKKAVDRARKGLGPSFLEIRTYRYRGHSMSDAQHYRTKNEVNKYKDRDPIDYVLNILYKKKIVNENKLDLIHSKVKEKIQECVDFAESSSFPEKEDLYKDVYKEDYNFIMD